MKKHQFKIIAVSLGAALAAGSAWGALGTLQVKSALGEPFSGSIVVSGEEAKLLLSHQSGVNVTGAGLHASVVPQGSRAVVHFSSDQPIQDPLLSFSVNVGQYGRKYTALLDPKGYQPIHASKADKAAPAEKNEQAAESKDKHAHDKAAGVIHAGKYHVRPNERLADIAARVPHKGLTLSQTIRALVAANPHAFPNGKPSSLRSHAVLTIPGEKELRALAKGSVAPKAKTEAPAQPAVKPAPETAKPVENKPETPAPEAATQPEKNAAPAEPAQQQPVEKAASEPAVAPAPATEASEAQAAPAEQKPAETAPQPQEEPAADSSQQEEGGSSGWLLGVAAVVALAGGSLLYRRKRQQSLAAADTGDDDDDGFIVSAQPETPVSEKVQPAVTPVADTADAAEAKTEPEENLWKPEVSDIPAETAPAQSAENVFDAPAAQQDTEQPVLEEDWSWLQHDQVSEKHDDVLDSISEPVATDAHDTFAVPAEETKPADDDVVIGGDWSSFAEEEGSVDVQPVEDTSAERTQEDDKIDDGLAWAQAVDEANEFVAAAEKTEAEQSLADTAKDVAADSSHAEPLEFEMEQPAAGSQDVAGSQDDASGLDFAQPAHQQAFAADGDESLVVSDIDWSAIGLSGVEGTAAEQKETAEAEPQQTASFATDLHADLKADHQTEAATSGSESGDLDWLSADNDQAAASALDSALDMSVLDTEEAAPEAPAAAESVTEPDSASWLEEANKQPEVETKTEEQTTVQPVLNPNFDDAEAGNRTVAMEAKLELAKMYLEIDDAATARATLHELIEEANGEVLSEAQRLLQQLGG